MTNPTMVEKVARASDHCAFSEMTNAQLHEWVVYYRHSNRPGADKTFCAIMDEIESRMAPESIEPFKAGFPESLETYLPKEPSS